MTVNCEPRMCFCVFGSLLRSIAWKQVCKSSSSDRSRKASMMPLFCSLAICSPVLPLRGHEHLDEVPAPVEQATRAAAPIGHAAFLRDGTLDRLSRHRLAD